MPAAELSAAVAELRTAGANRDAAVEMNAEASKAASARLEAIEKQLGKTATMLQRSERLLAPLPHTAVEQAAYQMMLDDQMAKTSTTMSKFANK